MLGRAFRLSRTVHPQYTRHLSSLYLSLRIADNKIGHPRVRIVVSKKISKKAVTRNRIKRLISGYFSDNLEILRRDVDIQISGKKGIENLSHEEIGIELGSLIAQKI